MDDNLEPNGLSMVCNVFFAEVLARLPGNLVAIPDDVPTENATPARCGSR